MTWVPLLIETLNVSPNDTDAGAVLIDGRGAGVPFARNR